MITSFGSPPDPQLFAGLVLIETRPKPLADSVHDKPDRAKRVDAINLGRREGAALIPILVDYDPEAQSRVPMDMIFQGCSMSLFQA
jgi:hypothetical protein